MSSLTEKIAPEIEKQEVTSLITTNRTGLWSKRLLTWGVEGRGTIPVTPEDRTDNQYYKNFLLWFSWNCNILTFSAGSLGPVVFGLSVRDSCLVILFSNLLCVLPPAYLTTWGPQLGLRQMIQARYSFGYFGVILPCALNIIGLVGFCVLSCILGGQTLASVTEGNISWSIGIIITAIISLLVSFCGITVLSWYERLLWIPTLIVFIVALGVGGKHISNVKSAEPASAPATLSFASTIAGFVIAFAPISSDFTIYFRPEAPKLRLFLYSYIGFLLPMVTLQCLGAAVAASAPLVPEWEAGYEGGNVGGLLEAMLHPTKGFGKFLTVVLSLSVAGNIAPTLYSVTLNVQVFIPALYIVPRYVFSIVATAIILPISIVGAHRFYDALSNFLSLIGYWASAFVAVVIVEHFVFRKGDASRYDISSWNKPGELPWGTAAVSAIIGSFGLVIPCMEQLWFVGPIGRKTGDIGFEVAFAVTAILYVPLRKLEIKVSGR